MADVQKLADAAEVIVQGYAFIDRGRGCNCYKFA